MNLGRWLYRNGYRGAGVSIQQADTCGVGRAVAEKPQGHEGRGLDMANAERAMAARGPERRSLRDSNTSEVEGQADIPRTW
jgi:hypothetical protein